MLKKISKVLLPIGIMCSVVVLAAEEKNAVKLDPGAYYKSGPVPEHHVGDQKLMIEALENFSEQLKSQRMSSQLAARVKALSLRYSKYWNIHIASHSHIRQIEIWLERLSPEERRFVIAENLPREHTAEALDFYEKNTQRFVIDQTKSGFTKLLQLSNEQLIVPKYSPGEYRDSQGISSRERARTEASRPESRSRARGR